MRTTIQLDNYLHESAKQYAFQKGVTFTSLIEEALRDKLYLKSIEPNAHITLKTVGGNGLHRGVDLKSNASILEMMD